MRIYVDMVGGYFDDAFAVETKQFFGKVENGDFVIVASDLQCAEFEQAADRIRENASAADFDMGRR